MSDTALRCVNHPKRQTRVRCVTCDHPICTWCMVESPVGMKCAACAELRWSGRLRNKPRYLIASAAAGLVGSTVVGAFLGVPALGLFTLLLPILAGFLVGEAISAAASRQGHGPFQAVAILSCLVGFTAARFLVAAFLKIPPVRAFDPFSGFGILLATLVAWRRVAR